MNDEIKEILDKLKDREETYRFCKQYKLAINDWIYEAHYLLDYITNLQQAIEVKNERIKEEQQEKERYIKFYNELNIWNKKLQQENYELKSKLECYENGAYYSSKVDELEQENERLNNLFEYNMQTLVNTDKLLENYKSRCEKAIEYNKEIVDNYLEEDNCEYCDGRYATAKHNINILQNGSEKDE